MNIFDKAKKILIEEEEELDTSILPNENGAKTTSDVIAESVLANLDGLISIDTLYSDNDLSNKEKSIYKIDDIKNALPDMPNDSKKASVLGMLSVSKIEKSEIEEDSNKRIDVLISALDQFSKETEKLLNSANELISEKEKEIEILKERISERKKLQEKQAELFEKELAHIKCATDFIS